MKKNNYLKLFFLLFICLIVCGCSGKYTLDMQTNIIKEIVSFSESNIVLKQNIITKLESGYSEVLECFEDNYSCKEKIYNNNTIGQLKEYANTFEQNYIEDNLSSYNDKTILGSNIKDMQSIEKEGNNYIFSYNNPILNYNFDISYLSKIFNNYKIIEDNDLITISISSFNKDLNNKLSDYTFEIVSKYASKENNADKINTNKDSYSYIWNYDNSSINNANIQIVLNKKEEFEMHEKKENRYIYLIIIGSIIAIGLIIFSFISLKSKKNNKI